MSDETDEELGLPFPIELIIQDTPRSHQAANTKGKEKWKQTVGEIAKQRIREQRELFFIDERPVAATIFYFPPAKMQGDVDNIVKLILDGMLYIAYPDDQLVERVIVQKFEPGVDVVFRSLTPTLERAVEVERPVVYIRLDDDLSWREVL